jgi:glycosyltransferase involved in cell wall biosynthesis
MKISVCMAAFNGELHIAKQINSILNQLSYDDQLVIVDDNSSDNTVEVVKNFKDHRILLIINQVNMGAALTFNRALMAATGDIIFLSDQDDRWYANKVATVVKILDSNNLDLLIHDAVIISGSHIINPSLFEKYGSSPGIMRNILSNRFTGCCMAFRRDILEYVLPISSKIGIFHDAWIGVLTQYFGFKVEFVPVPLMDFIRHNNNASSLMRRSMISIIVDRLYFIAALILHIIQKNLKI